MPPTIISSLKIISLLGGKFKSTQYNYVPPSDHSIIESSKQSSHSSQSLFTLSFRSSFVYNNPSDWNFLPIKLGTLLKNAIICEGCQILFIDIKKTPGSNPGLITDYYGFPFHSTYIEDHFFKWDSQDLFLDEQTKIRYSLSFLHLKRNFCLDCFWVHCKNATLTRETTQPLCPCITCSRSRLRPSNTNFSPQQPLSGLSNTTLAYLNKILKRPIS